jgi:hypothetical protein
LQGTQNVTPKMSNAKYDVLTIDAEQQPSGRWKFVIVFRSGRVVRSIRDWETKREAVNAGSREYRQKDR